MILAIDGASTDLSIALAEPDGSAVAEDAWTSAQRQSAELLPRVLGLLESSGRSLGHLSAVAVGTGPGSFTGLRVAMSLAKGLAVALDRPIVGVPSLVAWLEDEPETVAALARAGAREAYVLARDAAEPAIADAQVVRDRLANRPVVAPTELAAAFELSHSRPPAAAPTIAAMAARRLAAEPDGDDLRRLEPIYLRAPRGLADAPEGVVRWL
jgi:tRNA threonylcarbamoyl adenosine modification protein YeaZ